VRNISGAWHAEHRCPKRYLSSSEVLAQAKNGDEQFWKEKYHAANRKAQHTLMNSLVFFFLKGGRGERDFFPLFSMCSHGVLLSSHEVPFSS